MADRDLNRGATYSTRECADQTVEYLAHKGIISEVVEDGRYWRVNVYGVGSVGPVRVENRLQPNKISCKNKQSKKPKRSSACISELSQASARPITG